MTIPKTKTYVKPIKPKPYPVSAAPGPILLKYKTQNPHQPMWDKSAAIKAAEEFASLVSLDDTLRLVLPLWKQYVPISGHKALARALMVKAGLSSLRDKDVTPQ